MLKIACIEASRRTPRLLHYRLIVPLSLGEYSRFEVRPGRLHGIQCLIESVAILQNFQIPVTTIVSADQNSI